jgi:ABC-2 type transport system ATP-binding protein
MGRQDGVPLLSVSEARKNYGPVTALAGISFSAPAGTFLVLLGPNGVGKSTLVQLLTGLFVPDGGAIHVLGHDMRRDPVAALRSIGIVFQQPTLDLDLSVGANLRFHADLHGLDRKTANERIALALARFELSDARKRPARTLSGGNRRRLELARALLHQPRILIMDEPTVGLDPASRRDLLDHILDLKTSDGLLVLWATHLVDEAEHADRLIFLDRGLVAFDGTPEAALAATGAASVEAAFFAATRHAMEPGRSLQP